MKMENILRDYEDKNEQDIIFFKENLFFRAYNRSCLRFLENVTTFRVFKRHYKNVDRDVCYLGFPTKSYSTLSKIYGLPVPKFENDEMLVIAPYKERKNFDEFLAALPYTTKVEKKEINKHMPSAEEKLLKEFPPTPPRAFTIENFSESFEQTTELLAQLIRPIDNKASVLQLFRITHNFTMDVFRLTHNFSREYKYYEGKQLRDKTFALYRITYHNTLIEEANNAADAASNIDPSVISSILNENRKQIIFLCTDIRLYLRIFLEMKVINNATFARLNGKLETILQNNVWFNHRPFCRLLRRTKK